MRTSRRRLTSTTARFIFSSQPIAGRRRESSPAHVDDADVVRFSKGILADLEAGTTVVCDRYAFSGIAFTAAKVPHPLAKPQSSSDILQGISYEWCRTPDVGLPAPDLVLFFDLSPEAARLRGAYGEERYESTVIQTAVRGIFAQIGKDVAEKWHVVDAGESIDLVTSKVAGVVDRLIEQEKGLVGKLWQE